MFVISKLNTNVLSYCENRKINLDPDYDCLISYLMYEMDKKKSIFSDYFKTLPKDFSSFPIMFTSQEKEYIKNSYFYKRLIKFENEVSIIFNRLNLTDDYNYFLKIYLIIQSRSFGLDTPEKTIDALVPFGDMFNTSLSPKPCFWYFDDDYNFKVQAIKNMKIGEEITIRYNEGHNTDFLLFYGFTIENNPNGHIYDFEIKSFDRDIEENFEIDLDIKPSIKQFNLNKFRKNKNSEPLSIEEEIKSFEIIEKHIKTCLYQYNRVDLIPQSNINLINIKRVLDEEISVLTKNLQFIKIIQKNLKQKSYTYDQLDIKHAYDFDYFDQIKKIINLK